MLKKGLNLFLLVSCLLFVASIVDASPLPLWQLHVGDRSAFTKHDSIGTTWIVTTTVVGTQTFNVEGIDSILKNVESIGGKIKRGKTVIPAMFPCPAT